jgi:C_GCAxxG_C_C family probable redox protein
MTDKRELAKAYFLQGYNCAQAVSMAFADEMNMDADTVAKMVSAFGGGMGRMREVCGAVSGMFFVLSNLEGYSDPKDTAGKMTLYQRVQELAEAFRGQNGSIICRELLSGCIPRVSDSPEPSPRTEAYYQKRPCPELVAMAAGIVQEKILQKN